MIIKSVRVRTNRNMAAVSSHVFAGKENSRIEVLLGSKGLIDRAAADAKAWSRSFAIRHWIISPQRAISRDDAMTITRDIAAEFGFTLESALLVEHEKQRADPSAFGIHWHLLTPEVDAATGGVLSSRHDYARHEKIARMAEIRLGQAMVKGRHNEAVIRQLHAEGRLEIASAITQRLEETSDYLPNQAFTHGQHQATKRQAVNIGSVRMAVKAAYSARTTPEVFVHNLAVSSLAIVPGKKPGVWCIETLSGIFIGAGHRLAAVPAAEFNTFMESSNGTAKSAVNRPDYFGGDENASSRLERPGDQTSPSDAHDGAGKTGGPAGHHPNQRGRGAGKAVNRVGIVAQQNRSGEDEGGLAQFGCSGLLAALRGHSAPLQTLQAKSTRLAMTAKDRLAGDLMEKQDNARLDQLRADLDLPLPAVLQQGLAHLNAAKAALASTV